MIEISSEQATVWVVLVTGAGSGLGEATARVFAEAGHTIALLDRDAAAIERVRRELPETGRAHIPVPCDLRDADAVNRAVDSVLAARGEIAIVVNSAGIDHTYWIEQLTVEQFDQVLEVNLRGPFLVAKAVWPHMRARQRGHIFNIASTSALRASSGAAAYTASKFGLLGMSRAMNLEGRGDGIRVTTVVPGGMQTRFFDRFAEQGIPAPDSATLQDPANVARCMLFAAQMPPGSDLQELVVTSPQEVGWP